VLLPCAEVVFFFCNTCEVLGEVTRTNDGCSKNRTSTRNIPPKCNKQVTSKQQTRSFLTSINKSSKTTVVFRTAMTIIEIGISFPTLVDRSEKHYTAVLPESIICRDIEMQWNEWSHFYHRRPIVILAGKHQEKTKRRPIIMLAMHTLHTHILHDDRKRKRWQSQWMWRRAWCMQSRKRTELHWHQDSG
jgi:hypothetical protein